MVQVNAPEMPSSNTKNAADIFMALRSGVGANGGSGNLFEGLLAQVKVPDASKNSAKDPLRNISALLGKDATPARIQTALADDANKADRSKLEELLQRIKQDRAALHAERQQVDDHSVQTKQDSDKGKSKDPVKSAETERPKQKEECIKADQPKKTKEDVAAEEVPVEAVIAEVSPEQIAASTATETITTQTSEQRTDQDVKLATSGDHAAVADTAADLLAAEQAALLLIQKMLQHKDNENKTAAVEEKTNVEKGTDAGQIKFNLTPVTGLQEAQPLSHEDADELANAALPTPDKVVAPEMAKQNGEGRTASADKIKSNNASSPELLKLFEGSKSTPAPEHVGPAVAVEAVVKEVAARTTVSPTDAVTIRAVSASVGGNAAPVHGEAPRVVSPYDFASQLSAARTAKGGSAGLPSPIEQVALQLHKMVKDGNDSMTLNLRPAELGRIEIKLEFSKHDNVVKAMVVADNPVTLDLLQKDSGGLQRALQEAGLRADPTSLQFSLRGDGQQNPLQQGFNERNQPNMMADNNSFGEVGEDGVVLPADVETYYLTPGRVNLRV